MVHLSIITCTKIHQTHLSFSAIETNFKPNQLKTDQFRWIQAPHKTGFSCIFPQKVTKTQLSSSHKAFPTKSWELLHNPHRFALFCAIATLKREILPEWRNLLRCLPCWCRVRGKAASRTPSQSGFHIALLAVLWSLEAFSFFKN